MSLTLDRDRIFQLIGRKDYGLAGFILKNLKKCQDLNGPEFLDAVFSELGQPYQTGFHKGKNAWEVLKAIPPKDQKRFNWPMWNTLYSHASKAASERREFKTIGQAAKEKVEELIERSAG